jgi:hypothetical protein
MESQTAAAYNTLASFPNMFGGLHPFLALALLLLLILLFCAFLVVLRAIQDWKEGREMYAHEGA